MNKTLGSTLLVSGTMIGAGMLAMPLTSAGIGFTFTVVLLLVLWFLLTYSALLFVEAYQTVESDAGIGSLSAVYFGGFGRFISTAALLILFICLVSRVCDGRWWFIVFYSTNNSISRNNLSHFYCHFHDCFWCFHYHWYANS